MAYGVVDNLVITTPSLAVGHLTATFTNAAWQVRFLSQTNFFYTLERTTNFQSWPPVTPMMKGNGTNLVLLDTNTPVNRAFYRVKAERP